MAPPLLNSLGFVVVVTPGTRVSAAIPFQCQLIRLQPRRGLTTTNVGNVYVYGNQAGGNPYAILAPEQLEGTEIVIQSFGTALIWFDADNANDAVLVGLHQ